ncbi:MAG: hypothetical protein K8I29_08725 [Alphaproteobacteria bacterium]|uniref:Uncharacterized protein n=1 Tax=Candidatus Nitrobium versatile TaxID=2884831 RepID=A0A953JBX1_9BACT|nr:hypothetical protein [Candidatus Nitrobium versatile]
MRKIDDSKLLEMIEDGKSQKDCAAFFNVSEPAITKRLKKLRACVLPESVKRLTGKEQRFVLALTQGRTQTAAAMEAFDVTSRDSAKTIGCRLAKEPEIKAAITDLLSMKGASPEWVAERFKHWGDSMDPQASLRAVENVAKLHDLFPASKNMNLNIDTVTLVKVDLSEYENPEPITINQNENFDGPQEEE